MRDRIMDERLFELTYEARRRQDLIRVVVRCLFAFSTTL